MRLILNADDFGYDEDSTTKTIDCFEKGALTSATIMPCMPSTQRAIEYAKQNPNFSFGVHLTFIDGLLPLGEKNKISSLLTANNTFKGSNRIRISSLLGLLKKSDIIEETKRQIGFLVDAGVNVSHVDSHGHIHKFPVFQNAISEACNSFGIHKARKVQDVFLDKPEINPSNLMYSYCDKKIKKMFQTTDYFYMPASSLDTNWSESLIKKLGLFKCNDIIEVGVHPGSEDSWRKNEYDDVIKFLLSIKNTHHTLINWNYL